MLFQTAKCLKDISSQSRLHKYSCDLEKHEELKRDITHSTELTHSTRLEFHVPYRSC